MVRDCRVKIIKHRMSKFYINTPIYYVNDKPHIGHMYTTVVADALARFHRLKQEDVLFVTGTDENSQKNIQSMEKLGETDLVAYLARMAGVWRATWQEVGISFDDFIRTTEERHLKGVLRFWEAVKRSGDIYEGTYEGLYCTGCEGFKVESDLVNGCCPLHPNKPLDQVKERNYFFRLSAYRDDLLAYIEHHPTFIQPESRKHEIVNYISDHLADISISREATSAPAGIPVPGDESQKMYVWFDALLNYMTAVGYGTDDALFKKWWPTDVQLVGKDIIKFHCALWPAMIMSAAKNDPLLQDEKGNANIQVTVFAHGFFTIDGQKISKSLGNAVSPLDLAKQYPLDAIRYFLLREIPFGEDGDFSYDRLKERYHADLGNTLGNLVNRTIAMSKKYFNGCVPTCDVVQAGSEVTETWAGSHGLNQLVEAVTAAYGANHRCDYALAAIWSGKDTSNKVGLFHANKYIEDTQPFKLVKTDPEAVARILYTLLEACRWYAWMIHPVMPTISREIFVQLGLDADEELSKGWKTALTWGGLTPGSPLGEPRPLFPRQEG